MIKGDVLWNYSFQNSQYGQGGCRVFHTFSGNKTSSSPSSSSSRKMLIITHGTVIHLLNHNLGQKVLSYSFIIDNLLKWRNKSLLGHWTSFGSLCWHGNTSTCIASNHLDNNSLYIKKVRSRTYSYFKHITYEKWKITVTI